MDYKDPARAGFFVTRIGRRAIVYGTRALFISSIHGRDAGAIDVGASKSETHNGFAGLNAQKVAPLLTLGNSRTNAIEVSRLP